ncbi:hypothetical protein ACKFKF_08305 [Phormidesmis sp. 146-12]
MLDAPQPRPAISQLVLAKRPIDSLLSLTKTASTLKIIAPREGSQVVLLTVVSVAGLLGCWSLLGAVCGFQTGLSFGMTQLIASGAIAALIFLPFFKRFLLSIDAQEVAFKDEFLGFKWNRSRPLSRQVISRLTLHRMRVGTDLDNQPIWQVRRLIIWAGSETIELTDDRLFTEQELCWIAYELSNWLDLPVIDVID